MSECNCSVMWISSLDQYMTVETSHFRDCKYTNRTKGFCCNRKNFTVCNISAEFVVSSALQTIESDISRNNVSFKSSVCNFYRKRSCHDHLILHLTEGKLTGSCISAMESHKCIFQCVIKFAFDRLFVHILRYRVVDVKQCNCILAYNSSDELT